MMNPRRRVEGGREGGGRKWTRLLGWSSGGPDFYTTIQVYGYTGIHTSIETRLTFETSPELREGWSGLGRLGRAGWPGG